MELSEEEEIVLLEAYLCTAIVISSPLMPYNLVSSYTASRLIAKDLLKRDSYEGIITQAGKELIEVSPLENLLKIMWVRTDLPILAANVKRLVSKISIEELPVLLSHERKDIRKLARERFEELKSGS